MQRFLIALAEIQIKQKAVQNSSQLMQTLLHKFHF